MPDQPDPLGGQSFEEFKQLRPGEVSLAQPYDPQRHDVNSGLWGYGEAAAGGMVTAAPVAEVVRRIPVLGPRAAAATLGYGALGGVIDHAVKQNLPEEYQLGGWAGPLAASLASPWRQGATMLSSGLLHALRDPRRATAATIAGLYAIQQGVPAYLADVSQHIVQKAMVGLGAPLVMGAVDMGRRALRGDIMPLLESGAGAVGAAGNEFFDWATDASNRAVNALIPGPTPPPVAAEAPIPLRPPSRLPPLPQPPGRTRLTIDPPEGYRPQ
jgi:hypothetical protein